MFTSFALLCPGAIMLMWTMIMMFKRKTATKIIFMVTLGLCAIHLTADGIYLSPIVYTNHIGIANTIQQVTGPMLLPMLIIYVRALNGTKLLGWTSPIWFVLIISQAVASILFLLLMGSQQASLYTIAQLCGSGLEQFSGPVYTFYKAICIDWYRILLLTQITYIIIAATVFYHKSRFTLSDAKDVWRGKSARTFAVVAPAIIVLMIVCGTRCVLGDPYLVGHPGVSAILSFLIATIVHIVCYAVNVKPEEKEKETDPSADIVPPDDNHTNENRDKLDTLYKKFTKIMEQDRLYLYSTLNTDIVASKLNTSNSTVTHLVNEHHKMSLREYINRKRIEYAKSLLVSHPNAMLDYIAGQSGFLNTATFSKNFQQFVGLPPRLWSMNQRYVNQYTPERKP
ncbi:MAG: helix-turn-helix domain-containing protein [Bacteroidaceae bacterium]|nr:helix-turn-helix domain-containing protein [Bacteroidaceae bacterium]